MSKTIFSEEYSRLLAKLKKARLDMRLTQGRVATLLGKPQSYVSKIESGERRVDIIELSKFAKIYKRNINSFL